MTSDRPRVLVCGWAGAGNIGDELLHRRLLAMLRDHGAEPVVVSRDPVATSAEHGVASVAWGPRGMRVLGSIDAVCVGPGGLFQDTTSLWSLPGNLLVPLAATLMRRPVASVGVGAGPLERRSSGWLLRRCLAGSPVVTRDDESTAVLARQAVDAVTAVDLVFGMDAPTVTPRDEVLVAIGPVVSSGALRPAAKRLGPVPVSVIAQAVDDLASRLGCTIVLGAFRGERDRLAAMELAGQLRTPSRVLPDDVDAHVEQAAASRAVVASRYHPLVLAARFGVPSLAVSAQQKVPSLVRQIAAHRPGGAQLLEAWTDIADVGTLQPFEPLVPPGLDLADQAVAALVGAARHRSGRQR